LSIKFCNEIVNFKGFSNSTICFSFWYLCIHCHLVWHKLSNIGLALSHMLWEIYTLFKILWIHFWSQTMNPHWPAYWSLGPSLHSSLLFSSVLFSPSSLHSPLNFSLSVLT
jgi:hypothetical protein